MHLSLDFPEKLKGLFDPHRHKVLYGGRGGLKSWQIADALLVKSLMKNGPKLIGCFREIQKSIKDSVHRLLREQIERLNVSADFEITDNLIKSKTGCEFIFEGLHRNTKRIKSLEGMDIAWVEEAESVTGESWDDLIPTVRKENSEIWLSFNPQYEDDETYKRFLTNPPHDTLLIKTNYLDNKWFPEVLRLQMEEDKIRDPIKYRHVWLGEPIGTGRKVWLNFDKDLHVRHFDPAFVRAKGDCYMAMDPHHHYYPFCVWIALLPKNARGEWPGDFYKYVYAEWPKYEDLNGFYHDYRKTLPFTGTLTDVARAVYATDGDGIRIKKRFIDTRFAKGAGSSSWSSQTSGVVEAFSKQENGGLLFTMPLEKRMEAQRLLLAQDMTWNRHAPISEFNEPNFYVSPECKNVIASLTNHRLEEKSDKEAEKYKDPSDALRICCAGFQEIGYIGAQVLKVNAPQVVEAGRGYWQKT